MRAVCWLEYGFGVVDRDSDSDSDRELVSTYMYMYVPPLPPSPCETLSTTPIILST